MQEHKIFKPLSKTLNHHKYGWFEVPPEDYTSLSVVTIFLCVQALVFFLKKPFHFFSILHNAVAIDWQDHKNKRIDTDYSPYPRIGQVTCFIFSIAVIVVLLSTLFSLNALIKMRRDVTTDIASGIASINTGITIATKSDSKGALKSFNESEESFLRAQQSLKSIDPLTSIVLHITPVIGTRIAVADHTIEAGLDITRTAQIALRTYDSVMSIKSDQKNRFLLILADINEALTSVSPLIADASSSIEKINPSAVPLQYSEKFIQARQKISTLNNSLDIVQKSAKALLDGVGSSTIRRYLVLFQNNAELRPTGGFIGSLALIDILNGEIKHVEIPPGGPYDLRGSFHEKLNPPDPLRLVASEWNFQDANWWADFPTSAQKIIWFYEKSGGPTVDGVIAINASVIPRLIELTGPISLPSYNKQLAADSALLELQKSVELEYDKNLNKPKQIIADMFPTLMTALSASNISTSPQFLTLIVNSLKNKDVQFYFRNKNYQELAEKLNIAGEMKQFHPDYSMIVSTNIGGGKSDTVISTDVQHVVTVEKDGSIDVSLTLHRIHRGVKGDPFTGMQHNDYLRFYTPVGSQLIDSSGLMEPPIDAVKPLLSDHHDDEQLITSQKDLHHLQPYAIDQWTESNRTVFGGWLFTKPSSESEVTLRYRLPFNMNDLATSNTTSSYALLLQRQSGSTITSYTTHFDIPSGYSLVWKYGGDMKEVPSTEGATYHTDDFQTDQYIGFSLKK